MYVEKLTIRAPFLKHFEYQAQAFIEFKNYAKQASDMEWLGKVRVVETYMHNLPSIIKLIESRTIPHTDLAGKHNAHIYTPVCTGSVGC
jgi:hypothetical protein